MHVPASVLPNVLECNVIAYLAVPSLALGLRLSRPAARVTFPPPATRAPLELFQGGRKGTQFTSKTWRGCHSRSQRLKEPRILGRGSRLAGKVAQQMSVRPTTTIPMKCGSHLKGWFTWWEVEWMNTYNNNKKKKKIELWPIETNRERRGEGRIDPWKVKRSGKVLLE